MPTLVYLDGFEHSVVSVNDFGATDGLGIFDSLTGTPTIDSTTPRTGSYCLQCSPAGAILLAVHNITGADPAISVVSFYIRFPTLPTANADLFSFDVAAGDNARLFYRFASGKFNVSFSPGPGNPDINNDVGPVVSADTWYRVDMKCDVSANPGTLDCRIDGGTNVQDTAAQAASTLASWRFGQDATSTTYTARYDDFVASATAADYPIGAHKVLAVLPVDDRAGNPYGTNVFEQGTGVDLSSSNKAWQYLDDWPPNFADSEDAADHVTQSANSADAINVLLADTAESTVWAAVALAAIKADATGANSASTSVRDASDVAQATIYSGDTSEVSAHYRTVLVPGVDTPAELNGLEIKMGGASGIPGAPEWPAVMIQYAVPEAVGPANVPFIHSGGRGAQQIIFEGQPV